MTNLRLRLLSYIVIAYMMLAFAWWSVLLFKKNDDAYNAKIELQVFGLAAEGKIKHRKEFFETTNFKELEQKYKRQQYMIFGEASVFILSLITGIYLINRAYNKEMVAAEQQRNFLLSITHELKSPIASIQLVLETFLKRDLNPSQSNKLSQNALKDTERLHTLVNNLLLAAKVEGPYQPALEPLNLTELIEEIVQQMSFKFPDAKINFDAKGEIPFFTGDRQGLTSVVINLLENSIKYSDEQIDINIVLQKLKNDISLEFSDKGIGIQQKEKNKIFNKFYRVGSEDTRKTKGTGLGLYIVKRIIESHKGKINVKDNQPNGTIFNIQLPYFENTINRLA